MDIELRNVKYAAFASQDSNCFEATIYIDGKRAGTVRDDGHGGCMIFSPHELEASIDKYAATLPPIDCTEFGGEGTMPHSADTLVGNLLNKWLTNRDLKRMCSRQVCFRKPGETYNEGEYHTLKCKMSDAARAQLVRKYGPDVFILNDNLPK